MEKMQNPGLIFLIKFFMWKASKKHFFRSGKGGVLLLMDLIHANYLGTSPINLYFPWLISTKTLVQPFLLQITCFQIFSHLIPSHLVLVVAIPIFLGENGKLKNQTKGETCSMDTPSSSLISSHLQFHLEFVETSALLWTHALGSQETFPVPCWDVSCTPSAGKSSVKHGSAWSNTANATVSCVVKGKPWWRQKHIWIQMEKMQNPGLIFLIKFFMWKASKMHFFRSGKGGVLLLMDLIHTNYLGTSPINLYFPGLISTKTWVQPFLLQSARFWIFQTSHGRRFPTREPAGFRSWVILKCKARKHPGAWGAIVLS